MYFYRINEQHALKTQPGRNIGLNSKQTLDETNINRIPYTEVSN